MSYLELAWRKIWNEDVYVLECSTVGFCPSKVFRDYVSCIETNVFRGDESAHERCGPPTPSGYQRWFSIWLDVWGWRPFTVFYPINKTPGDPIQILVDVGFNPNQLISVHWTHEKPGLCHQVLLPLWQGWIVERFEQFCRSDHFEADGVSEVFNSELRPSKSGLGLFISTITKDSQVVQSFYVSSSDPDWQDKGWDKFSDGDVKHTVLQLPETGFIEAFTSASSHSFSASLRAAFELVTDFQATSSKAGDLSAYDAAVIVDSANPVKLSPEFKNIPW